MTDISSPDLALDSRSLAGARLRTIARRFFRNRLAVASLLFLALVTLLAVFAPLVAPLSPEAADPAMRLAPPGSPDYLLGGDTQGRDILSRLIWGGRSSLIASALPVALAAVLALGLGLLAGFSRGWAVPVIMRGVDILFAFPMILFAIGFATAFGPGIGAVAATIVFSATPYLTRVVYADVRAERDKEYVEAARALGASRREILLREILPNVLTPLVVYATTLIGGMIVFAASLSFIGLGAQPPAADWGRMASEGAKVLVTGTPHAATVPAALIVLVAMSFNWLGDGLRDALDPRG
ncbi:ABC transporter permease [Paenirhodobacter sp.]|uniref:ABC transporter permease n=1 Tax=Paenirhodobacter sp. TaxID=1965326 RepID=UPI003B408C98